MQTLRFAVDPNRGIVKRVPDENPVFQHSHRVSWSGVGAAGWLRPGIQQHQLTARCHISRHFCARRTGGSKKEPVFIDA